jgi:16S rRNA A1518/A1519 N6-dimethyltransferase RsmA/KsgA/DIM1 with predicted DNA glycosylase/AP lyase activity
VARRQNDFYPSPSALIKPIVSLIPIDSLICEPCAGEGHLSKPLLELGYQVKTYDIDPRIKDCEYLDATVSVPKCDWVVTNPPFNQAEKIVRNSLESAKSVAMLLRLSFLEPCKNRRDLITGISKLSVVYLEWRSLTRYKLVC